MAYGTIKVDTITFTDAGIDKSVAISGLVQNPTFTGNVTVTGTVSGATANFVSGVFTTQISGATVTGGNANFTSGTFTNISGGVYTITSGVFALGTSGTPSISFASDPNTGIYSPGADQVAISTNGTGRLFVDASGNVGVKGTPSFSLHSIIDVDSYSPALALQNKNTNGWGAELVFLGTATTDTQAKIGALATGPGSNSGALAFYTASSGSYAERFRVRADGTFEIKGGGTAGTTPAVSVNPSASANSLVIDSSGRVGLGTSSASSLFHVSGPSGTTITLDGANDYSSTASLLLNNGRAELRTTINASGGNPGGSLLFRTRNNSGSLVDAVTINSSQQVGIGVTDPVALLQPNGTVSITGGSGASSANGLHLYFDTSTNSGNISALHSGVDNRNLTLDGKTIGFTIAGSEKAKIDASGRLLVGTSTARSLGLTCQAQIEGTTNATSALSITNNQASAEPAYLIFGKSRAGSIGGVTSVIADDYIGLIQFAGADGTDTNSIAAEITCRVDGTPGTNDMPGRLVFSVTADGASSPTEAMRIKNTRVINFSNAPVYADNAAAKTGGLVDGDVYRTSTGDLKIVYT